MLRHKLRSAIAATWLEPVARGVWSCLSPVFGSDFFAKKSVAGKFPAAIPGGGKLWLNSVEDDWFTQRLYWEGLGFHEPETVAIFRALASQSPVTFDIGANIGLFALLAAHDNPDSTIFAMEPVPHVFRNLNLHIQWNGLTNLHAHNMALADESGTLSLFIPRERFRSARDASLNAAFREDCDEIQVTTQTLDTFVREHGLADIGLMKVDTETTEYRVLLGAQETLERDRPYLIVEVLIGNTEEKLLEVLKPHSYRYFWISENRLIEQPRPGANEPTGDNNYLMVPTEKWDACQKLLAAVNLELVELTSHTQNH